MLVDWAAGRLVRRASLDEDARLASLSPDGHTVGVASSRRLSVYDAATGDHVGPDRAEPVADISWITWSPTGADLVTGDSSGRVTIWDADHAAPREQLDVAHPTEAVYPAYLPDGRIVVPTTSGSVFVWDPSLQHAEDFACRLAGRDLSREEWAQSFGDRPFIPTCPD
jgi:WD40 repeat protein